MSQTKEECMQKMIVELNKFFKVYNSLSDNKILEFDSNTSMEYYSQVIKIIGNYIYNVYSPENDLWENNVVSFPGVGFIDFSVFKNTKYTDSVKNFLSSIKQSFDSNINKEIIDYFLSNGCEFTADEKVLCLTFYEKSNQLGKSIVQKSINNISIDCMAKESISGYAEQSLIPFNEIVQNISKNPEKMKTIDRFDSVLRKIAKNKVHPSVFFDDQI
jgi:hypothetical protein